MNIPNELLNKYSVLTLEEYKNDFGDNTDTEKMFYETFLMRTDHIPNKIIESQALGETPRDYAKILKYRQLVRDEINRLSKL